VEEESTRTVLAALRVVIEQQGLFFALYSDRASHFFVAPKAGEPLDKYRLAGRTIASIAATLKKSEGSIKVHLSRKALAILTNTKGVTCVLSGMRRPNYVDDSLGALRSSAFDVDLRLYEAFAHIC
jgi:aryl-alcohol dehydrogenase-like predicted oxidoreductase